MNALSTWSASRPYFITQRATALFRSPLLSGHARSASLSAIHRGIWSSEKGSRNGRTSKPDSRPRFTESRGRTRPGDAAEAKPDAFSDRFSRAVGSRRDGPRDREPRQHFKPKKAFQKMQEKEEEGGRKSRSKRFNNPEFSFGKKSLVYQLNRGELKDNVSKLLEKKDSRGEDLSKPPFQPGRREDGQDDRRSDRRPDHRSTYQDGRRNDRDDRRGRQPNRRDDRPQDRFRNRQHDRSAQRPSFSHGGMNAMRTDARRELEDEDAPRRRYDSRRSEDDSFAKRTSDFPVSLQYTTAASQFLFGRSVVKAALKNSRRKLYHLYVYQGSNKNSTKDDGWILAMAEKKKVKVTFIYENDQKLLDKMSKGRPHNGMVIEASPLPQLPLTGLGAESSEPKGYPVHVARQSKEEAEINGTEGFIPCRPGSPRPLVLLLNEILDPGNLGAILRTARFLGVSAVAITQRTSSTITSTVLKAAAGAAEEMRLFSVEDPVAFLDASQKAGWTSYAAVAPTAGLRKDNRQWTPASVEDSKPLAKEPSILILGNEGSGLPYDIRKKATREITIPRLVTSSSVDSLNVSVATALLCNSFLRGVQEPFTLTEKLQKEARKADAGESLF
ncbi:rRNA methyltransferase 1, mitochondrial [Colletotrichum tanaceti]|uniref:rRNA methyltransferase 1, mitochondrial n=1 Tax=Colletotrichum tanaceti TaxID=1306861 RepID=A0A4V6Y9F8_9PEZI|nr:rRNA methyltransferase 1, mitochondrial [Colletotrichum tanaceti]TKW53606.1 rRNA methyltransferase 1, mitochondrial [Colletotrichum tanaceti]